MPNLTSVHELPLPLDGENVNRAYFIDLVERLDGKLHNFRYTTAERNLFTGADLWIGRVIYNTSVGEHQKCTAVAPDPGGTWVPFVPVTVSKDDAAAVTDYVARIKRATDAFHTAQLQVQGLLLGDGATAGDALIKRVFANSQARVRVTNAADTSHVDLQAKDVYAAVYRDTNETLRNMRWGAGSPEGAITAAISSLYFRSDGTEVTTVYVKTTSGAVNTGWVAIATVNFTPSTVERVTAATTDWIARAKRAGDTQYRSILAEIGLLLGPGGTTAPRVLVKDNGGRLSARTGSDTGWTAAEADAFVAMAGYDTALLTHSQSGTILGYVRGGSPEGVVTAPPGSSVRDSINGKHYTKATGIGNTGWVVTGTQT